MGAAAGLYVSYRKQKTDERNSVREQDKVFTERFGSASNMLSHESAIVRLAGLQALARLADDSERDRSTCLGALCSYLRRPVTVVDCSSDSASDEFRERVVHKRNWTDPDEWDVRRNTLKLLLDRLSLEPVRFAVEPWDLREAVIIEPTFAGRTFSAAVDVRGAVFTGDVSLEDTRFRESSSWTVASSVARRS